MRGKPRRRASSIGGLVAAQLLVPLGRAQRKPDAIRVENGSVRCDGTDLYLERYLFLISVVPSLIFCIYLYSKGVASHSPWLPRIAATLGPGRPPQATPTGLCHSDRQAIASFNPSVFLVVFKLVAFEEFTNDGTLSGYVSRLNLSPRVAAKRGNPGLCDATPSE